jgi:C4-type Zn-finger protein
MEIITCPLCGSRNIHPLTSGYIRMPYFARGYSCQDCDFKGVPLIFSSEKIYNNFLNSLKKRYKNTIGPIVP